MKQKFFFTVFILSLFFFLPLPHADAQPALLIDADNQFEFAEYSYTNENYTQAVNEYRRFIFFFPEDDRVEAAMFQIGMSYFNKNRFNDAVDAFIRVINKFKNTKHTIKSYFMISDCYTAMKEFDPAISNLHDLITSTGDLNVQDEAYYRIGWVYLEMVSRFGKTVNTHSDSLKKAQFYFAKISPGNRKKYSIKKLEEALDPIRLNNPAQLPQKKPALAGTLSIVPGAGHLYCGRYRDALISFLLNAGLMLTAYEAFDNGNEALGGLISFVEIGFYSGNIYGAVSSAHKYNDTATKQYIEKIRENLKVTISSDYSTNILFSFKYNF